MDKFELFKGVEGVEGTGKENQLSKFGKKIVNLALVSAFLVGPANAKELTLAQALKNNASTPSEVLKKKSKQDTFKQDIKKISSDTYPAFLNVYGVGKRYSDNSYSGVGLKAHSKHAELTAEKGKDFIQGSFIGLSNLGNSSFYLKGGVGYLNLQNYKVGKYIIDPTQTTFGGALGYDLNNKFNVEGGYLTHKLTGAKKADTTAYTKYLELVYRQKTGLGQFDLTGVGEQQTAYGNNNNSFSGSLAYYPISDIKLGFSGNNKGNFVKDDYQVRAGIKYTFGGKKGHFSPYIEGTYNTGIYSQAELAYEDNIANRSLQWKDKFENNINIKQIVPEKVAPKEFEKKVKESFNQAPTISISANKTSVNAGENIILTANASDKDGNVKNITWYDSKGNKIGTGKTVTLTESTVGTYTYDAIAIDNDGATTKSGSISVEVNKVPNQAPTISISADKSSLYVGESITLTANASDADGSINSITWYDGNGNNIGEGTTVTITENEVGTYSYYAVAEDNDGATTESGSVSVEVKEALPQFTLSEVTSVYNVSSITKVSDTEYDLLFDNPDNGDTNINVTFHGNKGDDVVPVTLQTERVDSGTWATGGVPPSNWAYINVNSTKYPDSVITIRYNRDGD